MGMEHRLGGSASRPQPIERGDLRMARHWLQSCCQGVKRIEKRGSRHVSIGGQPALEHMGWRPDGICSWSYSQEHLCALERTCCEHCILCFSDEYPFMFFSSVRDEAHPNHAGGL